MYSVTQIGFYFVKKKMTVIDIYKRPPQIKFATESNKKDSEHKARIELFFNTWSDYTLNKQGLNKQ